MMNFLKKYKLDIFLTIILLILSLIGSLCFIFLKNPNNNIANIYVMNELKDSIDLTKENDARYLEFDGKNGKVKVEVKKDEIKIIESNCPNKYCIHQGVATSSRPIICAYNEVLIELKSLKDFDVELG